MDVAVGLDFGTTNSAIGWLGPDGAPVLARFAAAGEAEGELHLPLGPLLRPRARTARSRCGSAPGPTRSRATWPSEEKGGRLIQSLKSFLASRLFASTSIFGASFRLEDLAASILRPLREEASRALGAPVERAVVGRPVRFVNAAGPEDEALALARLAASLRNAGFREIVFEYEPVGAAWHYERGLERDELILIADFGGGTSDFSLLRVGPGVRSAGDRARALLGNDGVPLAGDAFDGRLVRHLVAPLLGRGAEFRSLCGRVLPIPSWIYAHLERWHHLSFLRSPKTLQLLLDLRREALEPEKLAALLHLVEHDLGFLLFRAVERTKRDLSEREAARFQFEHETLRIDRPVTRARVRGLDRPGARRDRGLRRRPAAAHAGAGRGRRPRLPDGRLLARAGGAADLRGALRRGEAEERRRAHVRRQRSGAARRRVRPRQRDACLDAVGGVEPRRVARVLAAVPGAVGIARHDHDLGRARARPAAASRASAPRRSCGSRPCGRRASASRASAPSTSSRPRRDALAEARAQLAARVLEARRALLPVLEEDRVAGADLLPAETLPAAEVDLAEVGLEAHAGALAGDRRPRRQERRSGLATTRSGIRQRAAATRCICSRPVSESVTSLLPWKRTLDSPSVSPCRTSTRRRSLGMDPPRSAKGRRIGDRPHGVNPRGRGRAPHASLLDSARARGGRPCAAIAYRAARRTAARRRRRALVALRGRASGARRACGARARPRAEARWR